MSSVAPASAMCCIAQQLRVHNDGDLTGMLLFRYATLPGDLQGQLCRCLSLGVARQERRPCNDDGELSRGYARVHNTHDLRLPSVASASVSRSPVSIPLILLACKLVAGDSRLGWLARLRATHTRLHLGRSPAGPAACTPVTLPLSCTVNLRVYMQNTPGTSSSKGRMDPPGSWMQRP